jgi:hypothetical protein
MSEQKGENNKESIEITEGISSQRLNLIIALCAIFISAASFYATYLQADAAERQVKAMTLPLMQFTSSNWDLEKNQRSIVLSLKNAGIGPAILKTATFKYKDQKFNKQRAFLDACCKKEHENYKERKLIKKKSELLMDGKLITSSLENNIILGQSKYTFLRLSLGKDTNTLLDKLDYERSYLSLEICYCSLLGECYITEKSGITDEVEQCPMVNE